MLQPREHRVRHHGRTRHPAHTVGALQPVVHEQHPGQIRLAFQGRERQFLANVVGAVPQGGLPVDPQRPVGSIQGRGDALARQAPRLAHGLGIPGQGLDAKGRGLHAAGLEVGTVLEFQDEGLPRRLQQVAPQQVPKRGRLQAPAKGGPGQGQGLVGQGQRLTLDEADLGLAGFRPREVQGLGRGREPHQKRQPEGLRTRDPGHEPHSTSMTRT